MPQNMKNINNSTQRRKWISRCDVHARDHAPKAPWAASGCSTRSAVSWQWTFSIHSAYDIKEPIREQEIKLECMNEFQYRVQHPSRRER